MGPCMATNRFYCLDGDGHISPCYLPQQVLNQQNRGFILHEQVN
jgi:hypothetical protein